MSLVQGPAFLGYRRELENGWEMWMEPNPDFKWPKVDCRVYWGSHGCWLERGHAGPHCCDCCDCENHPDPDSGCVATAPYYGPETNFYGEDAPGET